MYKLFIFILLAVVGCAENKSPVKPPTVDPLVGGWVGTIYDDMVEWEFFEDGRWTLSQSRNGDHPHYYSSGTWRRTEEGIDLLREGGSVFRDGRWHDISPNISSLEIVLFGEFAQIGNFLYERRLE